LFCAPLEQNRPPPAPISPNGRLSSGDADDGQQDSARQRNHQSEMTNLAAAAARFNYGP
jgi:hypothetical protein